jgi:hypothetical protein
VKLDGEDHIILREDDVLAVRREQTMAAKEILFDTDARRQIASGLNTLADDRTLAVEELDRATHEQWLDLAARRTRRRAQAGPGSR